MINIAINILMGVNILTCILLTLLVLMQKPRSEGLGAAFGGNFTESIFGAQTSDVLTKATIWLGAIFMALTLTLALLYSHRQTSSASLEKTLMQSAPRPAAAAPSLLNTNSPAAAPFTVTNATPVAPVPVNP